MNPRADIPDTIIGRPSLHLRRAFGVAGLALWISGAAWLIAHYLLQHSGPFGPQPSAWEPKWLAIHGAAAFAVVWLLGWITGTHVPAVWPSRTRQSSGIALLVLAGLLVVSGYLLYYVVGDSTRNVVGVLHWIIGLAALPAFFLHRGLRGRRSQIPDGPLP
jgi:hypothetical protein